jgi:Fe-S-cluster containining protein
MLNRYRLFLEKFDQKLDKYFEEQCEFVKCKEGCSLCCEVGDYPFSRLEAEYLMSGFVKLPPEVKNKIKKEIKRLKLEKPKMHRCPFLVDKKCSVYPYRGIVCRVHGLAWYDEDKEKIQLPYCVNKGLNYSKVFDREKGEVFILNPIKEHLRIDSILKSEEAEKYELECGEIRPLMNWF